MDWSKVVRIEVEKSLDYANDTAEIEGFPGFADWDLFDSVSLTDPIYGKQIFSGIVMEKTTGQTVRYTLAAPSVFLTRNECDKELDEPMTISEIVNLLAGDFTLHIADDAAETKVTLEGTVGLTIWQVLEDAVEQLGGEYKLFAKQWDIYVVKDISEHGKMVSVSENLLYVSDAEQHLGGDDLYSLVRGRATVVREGKYETFIYDERVLSVSRDLIDVVVPEGGETETTTEAELRSMVHKRVMEIKDSLKPKPNLKMFLTPELEPGDKLVIGSTSFDVKGVRHEIRRGEMITRVECEAESGSADPFGAIIGLIGG